MIAARAPCADTFRGRPSAPLAETSPRPETPPQPPREQRTEQVRPD